MRERYKEILSQISEHVRKEHSVDDHVLIIDGLNNFIRTWAASPATNSDGQHIGGIVGFLQTIGLAIRTLGPTRVIITFDGKGGSARRKKLYPEYKAGRKPLKRPNRVEGMTDEGEAENMRRQFRRLIEYLDCLPVGVITIENIEADDTIAYISKQILKDSKLDVLDFYTQLSDIVRRYLKGRFHIAATGQTTREFLIASRNSPHLEQSDRQSLSSFLVAADLVKFARFEPTEDACCNAIEQAEHFITATLPPMAKEAAEVAA